MATKKCAACGNGAKKLKACAVCLKTKYCSEKCQWDDWATHKEDCKKIEMPKRKAEEKDDERKILDDKLRAIDEERKKIIAQRKQIEDRDRVEDIRRKRQQIARIEKTIDTKQGELKQAKEDLEKMLQDERDAVDDKEELNDGEKEKLKLYLDNLHKYTEGIDFDQEIVQHEPQYYYYASVSTRTSTNSIYARQKYDSETLVGYEPIWKVLDEKYGVPDEEERKEEFSDAVDKVPFPPPDSIVSLMKRARVTLVVQPEYYSFTSRDGYADKKTEEAGKPLVYGYDL